MIGPVGCFVALRGFVVEGHVVRAGDPLDMTDGPLIAELLEAHKIVPRDDETRRRVEWRSRAQWTPSTRRERGQVYDPMSWG